MGRRPMTAILLDTHAWAWTLAGDPRLSADARNRLEDAGVVMVSAISFFEIAQKVRLGKWPEMEPFVDRLPDLLAEQDGVVAPLDGAICVRAGGMPWAHRDPFDRLIAATALRLDVALVSADDVFDGIVARVW